MKFDSQLADYLYQYKSLSLLGIGTFTLHENVIDTTQTNTTTSTSKISFEANKKATLTEELKDYLKTKNTKPTSLIVSDLEDYVIEIENWLNIGKTYTIEGIGTLSKKQNGIIDFVEGKPIIENIATATKVLKKSETEEKQIAYEHSNRKRNIILATLSIFLLATLGIIAWVLLEKNNSFFKNKNEKPSAIVETPKIDSIPKDTVRKDSINNVIPISDTIRYKMYFFSTSNKTKADKVYAAWIKYDKINRDSVVINDTLRYRLFIYKRVLPKDTNETKQKLKTYFAHDIFIEQEK